MAEKEKRQWMIAGGKIVLTYVEECDNVFLNGEGASKSRAICLAFLFCGPTSTEGKGRHNPPALDHSN